MEHANCQRAARNVLISTDIIWQQCPPEMAPILPRAVDEKTEARIEQGTAPIKGGVIVMH
jgi:hypothetical protein